MSLRTLRWTSTLHAAAARRWASHQRVSRPCVAIRRAATQAKDNNHDEPKGQSQRWALRPFTVLALCIPAGYALRWMTSDDYGGDKGKIRSADGFAKYVVAERAQVSPTLAILTLEPRDVANELDIAPPGSERAILSVEIKQPMLQVARAYTLLPPLPPRVATESGHDGCDKEEEEKKSSGKAQRLRVLLRRQPAGEVSRYVHDLAVGAEVEVRGPRVEAVLPDDLEQVIFLAAGTGIAPALRVAQILAHAHVSVSVLWASRRREDCVGGENEARGKGGKSMWTWWPWPGQRAEGRFQADSAINADRSSLGDVVRELEWHRQTFQKDADQMRGGLQLAYYVDEEGQFIRPRDVVGLIDAGNAAGGRRMLFVSGPEGFVKYWAGEPTQWRNGREVQGAIHDGELARMETGQWDVVRLS